METFLYWKERGNQLFNETCSNQGLPACVYQMRLSQVIQFYNKAIQLAPTAKDRSSVWKNLAVTQFRIGEKIFQPQIPSEEARKKRDAEVSFYLKESLLNFGYAIQEGAKEHGKEWTDHLMERRSTCAELLWNCLVQNSQKDSFPVLAGRLHQFCWNMDEPRMRSKFFQRLAKHTFEKAVEIQESGEFKESLELLHNNHLAIEEAKKFPNDDVEDLEKSNFIQLCVGESVLARRKGDSLWEDAVSGDEELNMELVWDAVDCYNQSIIKARDKCLESEAIAHCQLGKIYGSLNIHKKSREHYKMAVDLEFAMRPMILTHCKWYKEALAGLERYQKEDLWDEMKEREAIRTPIRIEMKEILDELKRVSRKSTKKLLDFIYDKHPPKQGAKSDTPDMKQKLKQALLHYHPDKQDLETYGLKWVVLTEEVTVLLTHHFSYFKH